MNYNQNSGWGLAESIRMHLGLPVMGKVLVVAPSTDANYDRLSDIVKTDPDGIVRLYTTIDAAYTDATTNAHDVIALSANSGHAVPTAGLVITKNRMHIMGLDGSGRRYGLRSRVTAAAAVTEIGAIKNTGVGNTFRNIKVDSASTVAASIYAAADGGEYSYWKNCELYKSTDLDQAGAAELLCNTDSGRYENLCIGSNVNIVSAASKRPCVLVTRETITGKVCRDTEFIDCLFWRKTSDVNVNFVYGANANDVERMLLFERCIFHNTKLSSATMEQAIQFGAAQTQGYVLVKDCAVIGCDATSTSTGVYLSNQAAAVNTGGEFIQAA